MSFGFAYSVSVLRDESSWEIFEMNQNRGSSQFSVFGFLTFDFEFDDDSYVCQWSEKRLSSARIREMGRKKRKYSKDEIRELFEFSAPESEPENLIDLVVCSMNTYFGTNKAETDLEKPYHHKLMIFPSKEFCTSMLRYDELSRAKSVRQDNKYCPFSKFIQSASRIFEFVPLDQKLKEELRLQRNLHNRPAALIIDRFWKGKSNYNHQFK